MNTIKSYLRTAWSWDLQLALGMGVFAGLAAVNGHVRAAGVTILLAETALGAAFVATVLTALGVFVTFFDSAYRRVLEEAGDGDLGAALEPYKLVGYVAGFATVAALLDALAWPALGGPVRAVTLGISTFLTGWTVLGAVSLIGLTVWHGKQRAALMRTLEQAREASARLRASQSRTRGRSPQA